MPKCNITGESWHAEYSPANAVWPHPALAHKMKQVHGNPYLSLCSALFYISERHRLVIFREPLQQSSFAKAQAWLELIHGMLRSFEFHLTGLGSKRLASYPCLVVDSNTTNKMVEAWINECVTLAEEYEQLSTIARDIANEQHRKIVAAANRRPERESEGLKEYIHTTADCAGLEGIGREHFFSAIRAPYGVSDKSITNALDILYDHAPKHTIDEQLFCDVLTQRLSDALLDSAAREQARTQKLNSELARDHGLFNVGIAPETPTPAPAIKNNPHLDALRALLAQRRA